MLLAAIECSGRVSHSTGGARGFTPLPDEGFTLGKPSRVVFVCINRFTPALQMKVEAEESKLPADIRRTGPILIPTGFALLVPARQMLLS